MKTDFHNKDFTLRLALKWRLRRTRKWPIRLAQIRLPEVNVPQNETQSDLLALTNGHLSILRIPLHLDAIFFKVNLIQKGG